MEVVGLVPWSSNYTFLATVRADGDEILAVYKPARGERPLWDFEDGTLCQREVAAYVVSDALGFPNIPPTVLREGPEGIGSVQMFVEFVAREHFFTLRDAHRGAMQEIALFDALVNNTDRKGGHVLLGADGKIWCIDHGVTFHAYPKLRTVIWDFVREPIPSALLDAVKNFRASLTRGEPFTRALTELLSRAEMDALRRRADKLLSTGLYPEPPEDWPHVPWPPI
jgi:uncharacterized repeat protein (TIGR03843 family)